MQQYGEELVRYFVYCCEGDSYGELLDQFRLATTRFSLLETIYELLHNGESLVVQSRQAIKITPQQIEEVCDFIQSGEIAEVRDLHQFMITKIFQLEMEKIKQTEQVLLELLSGLE